MASLLGDRGCAEMRIRRRRNGQAGTGAGEPLKLPHFAPKAKRAIYLFMSGGPPQMDLLDYKPNLAALYDKDIPDSVRGAQQLTGMTAGQARFPIAPSHWAFKRYGQTGTWVSDLLPYTGRMVDDLTIIKSTNTEAINHEPAIMLMNTGNMNAGKPCLGSWLAYGLGSMNDNLPTFMVLQTKLNAKENNQPVSSRLWSSGFLSSEYAGVGLRSAGDPVLYLTDPERRGSRGAPQDARRGERDQSADLRGTRRSGNEFAHRAVRDGLPDADLGAGTCRSEQGAAIDVGSLWAGGEGAGNICLQLPDGAPHGRARRALYAGLQARMGRARQRDRHSADSSAGETDRGCYALVTDLKQRGLLDDTLVIWAGEFGRTVYSQGGLTQGELRPRSSSALLYDVDGGRRRAHRESHTARPMSTATTWSRIRFTVRDFNATILHCLGIDHNKLTYKFQGLDQKLTGPVPASVVKGLLA